MSARETKIFVFECDECRSDTHVRTAYGYGLTALKACPTTWHYDPKTDRHVCDLCRINLLTKDALTSSLFERFVRAVT